jgi:anti-sigma factor RsiW
LNCEGVIREISNYIDGDLDPAVTKELERHLDHCEDCRMVVDQTRKTIEIFCGAEPVPLPEDLRTKLHAAFREKKTQKPS